MAPQKKNPFTIASSFLTWLLAVVFISHAAAWYHYGNLPKAREILPQLAREPEQSPTERKDFTFNYRSRRYHVVPVAEYDLVGLVVSHNNIHGIADAYHTKDSVDIKDICVIWGTNVADDRFHSAKFWNETWTCNVRIDDRAVWEKFNMSQLSNNHLLSGERSVRDIIETVRPGDQVRMKGMLVNYYPEGLPDMSRNSSTTREDRGDGACEVVYVESFKILKEGFPYWNAVYDISWKWLLYLVPLKILTYLIFPYLEYRFVS